MATIKSHTDLPQSQKLSEILPSESADMEYLVVKENSLLIGNVPFLKDESEVKDSAYSHTYDRIACWSLSALLNLLPNEIITNNRFECHYQIQIRKYDGSSNTTLYQIAYGNDRGSSGSWHDMINSGEKESLIDCCFQIIIRLKEINLL